MYFANCGKQGVDTNITWKRLATNYSKFKIHYIILSCKIARCFIEGYKDLTYLWFIIEDVLNGLTRRATDFKSL